MHYIFYKRLLIIVLQLQGEPISPDEFTNETLIIWNERASEIGEDAVEGEVFKKNCCGH